MKTYFIDLRHPEKGPANLRWTSTDAETAIATAKHAQALTWGVEVSDMELVGLDLVCETP